MSITIRDVLELLPATSLTNVTDLNTPIGEIVPLADLRVVGARSHATLVSCSPEEVAEILRGEWERVAHLLPQCIIVTTALGDLQHRLEDGGYSYLLGPSEVPRSLFDTVSGLIHQNLAYEDRMVTTTMRALTLIARTSGVQGVLSELSRAVDGWAVLLDSHGQVMESVGAARLHIEDAVAVVLNRAVRIRYPDLQVHIVGSSTDDEHAARLVIASRLQSAYRIRTLAAHAAALLALMLRTTKLSDTERHGRELMLDTLIHRPSEAERLLRRWKITESHLSAFVMSTKTRNIDVARLTSLWLDRTGAPPLYVANSGEVYGFAPLNALEQFADFANEFQTGQGQRVTLGLGEEMRVDSLGTTLRQAHTAHDAAGRTRRTVLRFADLVTVREMRLTLTGDQQAVLGNILDPIIQSGDASHHLLHSLYVFLAHRGSWTPTARELQIHRQTLINRMRQVEQLLDVSLENPDHQALLWLALREAGVSRGAPSRR